MARKILVLMMAFVLSAGWVAAQIQACPELVETALSRTQDVCTNLRGNQACYGYQLLDAELSPVLSPNPFENVGDRTSIEAIRSLSLSPMDVHKDIWGVALLRLRLDNVDTIAAHAATIIAFGGTTLLADTTGQYPPMQAFTFRTDASGSECSEVVENGLLIQTPNGVGRMTFWVNQVKISIGSTILFQAQPSGDMIVSTFEGSALVEAYEQMQEAVAGMQVRVSMDANLQPVAPPTMPEPFDPGVTGLSTLLSLSQQFTEGSIVETRTVDTVQDQQRSTSVIIQPVVETLVTIPPISVTASVEPPPVQGQQVTPTPNTFVPTVAVETPTFTPGATATETFEVLPTIFETAIVLSPSATNTVAVQPTADGVDLDEITPISASPQPPNTAVPSSPTPEVEGSISTATATNGSNMEGISSTVTPPAMTTTPQMIATPTISEPMSSSTPTSPEILPTWTATAPVAIETEGATPADCNGDHGNGNPNGNCYGHENKPGND